MIAEITQRENVIAEKDAQCRDCDAFLPKGEVVFRLSHEDFICADCETRRQEEDAQHGGPG